MHIEPPPPDIVERLAQHRTIGKAPRSELEWLAANGRIRKAGAGEYIVRKGDTIEKNGIGLEIVLSGLFSILVDRGGGPRRVLEWQGGDVGGYLPFSRMTSSPGDSVIERDTEALFITPDRFSELIRECPVVTGICVHVMLDRARIFNTSDWQDEKMASLGRLAAGLAHELNNPASAVARSGMLLLESIAEADAAARAVALARLTEEQLAAVDRVRSACMRSSTTESLSPLERAHREEQISDWLHSHGADDSALDALVETGVSIDELAELATVLKGDCLDAALDWVAAGCAIRMLATENERAASRISELVGAMKRLTHMDRAPVPEPLNIEQGIRDTMAILGHKARSKLVSVRIDVQSGLPKVHAIGGELNQVWMNLLDNALDACARGGNVEVTVRCEGPSMVVRVVDDGAGIAPEDRHRIFDPFFTTKPPGEGTGLGLEVARARVRGNGGDIDFESRPGRTEFRVFLPLRDETPQAASAAALGSD